MSRARLPLAHSYCLLWICRPLQAHPRTWLAWYSRTHQPAGMPRRTAAAAANARTSPSPSDPAPQATAARTTSEGRAAEWGCHMGCAGMLCACTCMFCGAGVLQGLQQRAVAASPASQAAAGLWGKWLSSALLVRTCAQQGRCCVAGSNKAGACVLHASAALLLLAVGTPAAAFSCTRSHGACACSWVWAKLELWFVPSWRARNWQRGAAMPLSWIICFVRGAGRPHAADTTARPPPPTVRRAWMVAFLLRAVMPRMCSACVLCCAAVFASPAQPRLPVSMHCYPRLPVSMHCYKFSCRVTDVAAARHWSPVCVCGGGHSVPPLSVFQRFAACMHCRPHFCASLCIRSLC